MKKKLTVLALAFAMVLTMSASVFAEGTAGQNNSAQHPSYAADAAKLVKYLQAPEGATLPTETFTFTFTPIDSTAANYGVKANEHAGTSTTIAIADMADASSANDADTQNKVASKSIADIFDGYTFPHAGEYAFTVAETAGSNSKITYAADTYTLRLVVDKDGNIDDVTVQKGDDGEKVDPTDVVPGDNADDVSPADSKGGFTFTNLYKPTVTNHEEPGNDPDDPNAPDDPKNPDPDPDDPQNPDPIDKDHPVSAGGAFVLDKYVLGEYGDQSKDFVFTVTVTLPKSDKTFNIATTGNPTVTANKGSISGTWADGQAVTVNLKHGGELKFAELPVGTKIAVSETAVGGYKQVLTTSQSDNAATVLVGDKGGYAIMRNSFDDTSVTPTGIIINNLPYVLLIGLALGGIVLFSRKRRYE